MFGDLDFNSTPLASPGTKVLVRVKPSNRQTFGTHVIEGWYIGPSMNHYRYYCYYVPETGAVRNFGTTELFPQKIIFRQ